MDDATDAMADGGGCCEDSPPDAAQHEEEDVPKTRLQPGCRARVSKADEEASVEEGLVGQEVAVEGWPSVLAGGSPRWPVRLVVSDRRLNIPATSLHAEQRDMFARLGDSAEADDLLSLLLEGCDLDAMVQIKAASRRLRALTRQVIGGRAWRSHPEHLHQMRCALWRGARYQYFSSAPHTDAVSALVIDGPLFATGSWDRTVKVWSSELGQSAYSLPHAEAVVGVALRNGRLASSGCDGKLRVWCPRLGSIELPNSAINSTGPLAWATSSQLLVGGAPFYICGSHNRTPGSRVRAERPPALQRRKAHEHPHTMNALHRGAPATTAAHPTYTQRSNSHTSGGRQRIRVNTTPG